MDYFFKTVEAAQKQAQSLSLQVSQSAKGLSEQLGTQTRSLAEQAVTASSSAAEQAGQRWKELNIQETLQLKSFQSSQPSQLDSGPSEAELDKFGINPSFQEFVRSLTYSTFRDFPLDELPATVKEDPEAKILTPWQEKHALLIVQQVKEINELRFVLCPKRMNDAQFWSVYFRLSKKYLPPEAFDPDAKVEEPVDSKEAKQTLFDFQGGFKRTLETAKSLASKASTALQPVDASGPLHEMVTSHREEKKVESNGQKQPLEKSPQKAAEPDLDQDLEAYLRTMSEEKGTEGQENTEESQEGEEVDLDDYLNELEDEEKSDDGLDSEEYLDVAEEAPKS